jgi:hypothetical protein
MLTGEQRRAFGYAAVVAGAPDWDADDEQTTTVDALANMMHWAATRSGVDFEQALDSARLHFAAEALTPDDIEEDRRRVMGE